MQKLLECKKFLGFGFIACVILIPLMIEGISDESDKFALFLATYLVALLGLWKDKNKLFTIIYLFLWGLLCFFDFVNPLLFIGLIFGSAIPLFFWLAVPITLYYVALVGLLSKKKQYRELSQIYFGALGYIVLILLFGFV